MEGAGIYPKVNVNTAGFEDLVAVPYIGPATAKRILEYRAANGPFKRLEDVKQLKGIYPTNYDRMVHYLRL